MPADVLVFDYNPLILCTCGGLPMETSTKKCLMTNTADTVAAGEGKFTQHPHLPGAALGPAQIITQHPDINDDAWPALIAGDLSEIQTVPLELPEDAIIQATELQFMAWGK